MKPHTLLYRRRVSPWKLAMAGAVVVLLPWATWCALKGQTQQGTASHWSAIPGMERQPGGPLTNEPIAFLHNRAQRRETWLVSGVASADEVRAFAERERMVYFPEEQGQTAGALEQQARMFAADPNVFTTHFAERDGVLWGMSTGGLHWTMRHRREDGRFTALVFR